MSFVRNILTLALLVGIMLPTASQAAKRHFAVRVLDTVGDVGAYSATAVDSNDLPFIAYFDATNTTLRFGKCTTTTCVTMNQVSYSSLGGEYVDVAIGSDDLPAVSYYNAESGDLMLAKCMSSDCSGTLSLSAVDSTGDVGKFTALVLDSTNLPVISYYDATNADLKVVKCATTDCSSSTITTIADTDAVGQYNAVALTSDDMPVISYYNATDKNAQLALCSAADCSGETTLRTLDSDSEVGQYTSIVVTDTDLPIVSYYDAGKSNLKLAACSNTTCSDVTVTAIDKTGQVDDQSTTIGLSLKGNPIIMYGSNISVLGGRVTTADLRVVKCSNVKCTERSIVAVDAGRDPVGGYFHMALRSTGLPVLSYYDPIGGDLKFARAKASFLTAKGSVDGTSKDTVKDTVKDTIEDKVGDRDGKR